MIHIIVATSPKEQQEIMHYLEAKLKEMYLTDMDITILRSGFTQIKVVHRVKDNYNTAATYQVPIVPVTMSLDKLRGLPFEANININKLLKRIDELKDEAITYVNTHRVIPPDVKLRNEALKKAAASLFS